eukprot:12172-Heterococcus_DN1.PRE.3
MSVRILVDRLPVHDKMRAAAAAQCAVATSKALAVHASSTQGLMPRYVVTAAYSAACSMTTADAILYSNSVNTMMQRHSSSS